MVGRLAASGHEAAVFHRGQTATDLPAAVLHIQGDRQCLAEHAAEFRRLAPDVVVGVIAFTEPDACSRVAAFRDLAGRAVVLSSGDVYRAYGVFTDAAQRGRPPPSSAVRPPGGDLRGRTTPCTTTRRFWSSELRAGRGAITKSTEFGMVSWEQAFQGVTHGMPGLETSEFERVLVDAEEDWYGVRVPQEHLFELLRTPGFNTWQDETWLFCCKRPMTYLGEWASVLKVQFQGTEARAVFDSVFDPDDDSKEWVWERLSGRKWDTVCVYVFHCKTCNRFKSTRDMD